ncbi:hypothetical protein SDC9_84112 [bioreactor metagenome]|uniref:Uncharacterized protein n=1 Tax=bioreactor metagenome TaxID=1076179 RepID=A0A644Z9D3_9ZZZZ
MCLAVKDHQQPVCLFLFVTYTQQLLFFPVFNGQVGGTVAYQHTGERLVIDGLQQLLGGIAKNVEHMVHSVPYGIQNGAELLVVFLRSFRFQDPVVGRKIGLGLRELCPFESFLCLDNDAQVVFVELNHAYYFGDDTY